MKKGVRKWKLSKCQHKEITYSLSRVSWEESFTKEGRKELMSLDGADFILSSL
jgi:hypothetical protein